MKYCPNSECVAHGRVVYSQSTRCPFCRWDLLPPRMKSETSVTAIEPSVVLTDEGPAAQSRRHPHSLRPTA